jgi:hypothetical protein
LHACDVTSGCHQHGWVGHCASWQCHVGNRDTLVSQASLPRRGALTCVAYTMAMKRPPGVSETTWRRLALYGVPLTVLMMIGAYPERGPGNPRLGRCRIVLWGWTTHTAVQCAWHALSGLRHQARARGQHHGRGRTHASLATRHAPEDWWSPLARHAMQQLGVGITRHHWTIRCKPAGAG